MWVHDLGIPGVTRNGAFRGEAIPGGKTLIEDMPLTLQQDVTYEETKEYLEKVIMMKYIKHERTCWTTFSSTKKRIENTTRGWVFLTTLEVFGIINEEEEEEAHFLFHLTIERRVNGQYPRVDYSW